MQGRSFSLHSPIAFSIGIAGHNTESDGFQGIAIAEHPHLHASLFLGALRGSWGHEPALDRPVAPGEVEEGEGEVEKLSIPVASGLHIVLAIKPPGIKLKWNEYKRNELWVTPSHKINLSSSSLPTVVEVWCYSLTSYYAR